MGDYWNTALTVLETCEEQGVNTDSILRRAGLDRTTVEDPEGKVPLDQMRHFWQEALTQSKDPAIGLHAGVRPPRGRYGLFEFPEPGPTEPPDEHARVLRCDIEFGAPRTEFILSRETWGQPVRSADAGLVGLLEQQAVDLWHNSQAPPRS